MFNIIIIIDRTSKHKLLIYNDDIQKQYLNTDSSQKIEAKIETNRTNLRQLSQPQKNSKQTYSELIATDFRLKKWN